MDRLKLPKTSFQYFAIIVALVFVGQFPAITRSLNELSAPSATQLANVIGMSVGVPPNEINLLAQDLEKKQLELTERERAIDAREREVRAIVLDENAKQMRLTVALIVGVTVLLIGLIGLNFYFDRRRGGASGALTDKHDAITPQVHNEKTGPHAHEGEFSTRL